MQRIFIKTELLDYRKRGRCRGVTETTTIRKEGRRMKAEIVGKIKYGVWGFIGGAVIAMVIGFAWGGWTTSGTTQKKSDAAVLASQAAICVAQYIKEPNSQESSKNLRRSIAIKDMNSLKKGAGTKCLGKKRPAPVLPAHVSRGLKFLSRNKTNQQRRS